MSTKKTVPVDAADTSGKPKSQTKVRDTETASAVRVMEINPSRTPRATQNAVPPKRLFSNLEADETPVHPLPTDTMAGMEYPKFHEPRCVICRSPFRERAEHVYLEDGRKSNRVKNWFAHYFDVNVAWESVETHMKVHCDFSQVRQGGITDLTLSKPELARWLGNEYELVLSGLLVQIDEVGAIPTERSGGAMDKEMKLKKAAMLDRLFDRLLKVRKERDEHGGTPLQDIYRILFELYNQMPTDDTRGLVIQMVEKVRLQGSEVEETP